MIRETIACAALALSLLAAGWWLGATQAAIGFGHTFYGWSL